MAIACSVCEKELAEGEALLIEGDKKGETVALYEVCHAGVEAELQAELEDPNIPGAIVGGLVAAIAGALVWYLVVVGTQTVFSILAIGLGVLVAQGVIFGAGRKRGRQLQFISAALTLLALVVSEYFINRSLINKFLLEEMGVQLELFLPVSDMIDLIKMGIEENPMTAIFWVIGVIYAWLAVGPRKLKQVNP